MNGTTGCSSSSGLNGRAALKTLSLSIGHPMGNLADVNLSKGKLTQGYHGSHDVRNGNFLSTPKSRVPDIQMINKYYGLVPKKFVFNRRTDFRSLRSQLDFSSRGVSQNSDTKLEDYRLVTRKLNKFLRGGSGGTPTVPWNGNINLDRKLIGQSNESYVKSVDASQSTQEIHKDLVAKKIPVANNHKWRMAKDRGRSHSLCEDFYDISHPVTCANCTYGISDSCGQSEASTPEPDVQRVIKINLHSMKWEESFKVREEQNLRKRQVFSQTTKASRRPLRKAVSVEENLVATSNPPEVYPRNILESTTKTLGDGEKMACKMNPRPATTSAISQKSRSKVPAPPVKAYGDAVEKRRAFQKSHSVCTETMEKGESFEDEQKGEDIRHRAGEKNNGGGGENGKYLCVQPPPEISTMISIISPRETGALITGNKLKGEINDDSVMDIMKMTNGIQLLDENDRVEPEEKGTKGEIGVCGVEESKGVEGTALEQGRVEFVERAESPTKETRHHHKHNIPLRKAASISCEQEITEADDISHNGNPDDFIMGGSGGKVRCKTAKTRGNVSFAKTASMKFIPSRIRSHHLVPPDLNHIKQVKVADTIKPLAATRTSTPDITPYSHASSRPITPSAPLTPINGNIQSRASKNRKLLLKKALAELNQASASLNKKLSSQRPRTAPIPEQMRKSSSNFNPDKINSRQRHQERESRTSSTNANSSSSSGTATAANAQAQSQQPEIKQSPPKRRSFPRQDSITFMENLFSSCEENSSSIPGSCKDSLDDPQKNEQTCTSSKKREECLRIYEKMRKTGCTVKLETIFRGMMTPSEYRIFMETIEQEEKEI